MPPSSWRQQRLNHRERPGEYWQEHHLGDHHRPVAWVEAEVEDQDLQRELDRPRQAASQEAHRVGVREVVDRREWTSRRR